MLQKHTSEPRQRAIGWIAVAAIAIAGVVPYRVTAATPPPTPASTLTSSTTTATGTATSVDREMATLIDQIVTSNVAVRLADR